MTRNERLLADGYSEAQNNAPPILFYSPRDKHGIASNFSTHSLILPNPFTGEKVLYSTGEHRYQAMKARDLDNHEMIRMAVGPGAAKRMGGQTLLRPEWGNSYGDFCYYVMLEVITVKVAQIREAKTWLLSTDLYPIYEDSPTDDIWGWRFAEDHRGKNLLGRCWMQVRETIR